MNRRTHESPMDFEWQSPGGPADPTSPFYKLAQNNSRRTGFDSPSKPLNSATTSSFFTATPAKAAPPFRNPSFTTPRKPFDADLFSETSGAESSPADNADNEDTPEVAEKKVNFTSTKVKQPIFGKYGLGWGTSPGREAKVRTRHTETALHKVKKRKRIDRDHYAITRRGSTDSDEDSGASRPNSSGHETSKESWIGSFFTSLENRKGLPYVLAHYPQILLNYFLFGVIVWLIISFMTAISADLKGAQEAEIMAIRLESAQCMKQYNENRCAPHIRVPAMEQACKAWEQCMERPEVASKSRVTAQAMGQALNSFIEPISWKAMVFVALLFGVGVAVSHALGNTARAVQHPNPQPQPQQWFPTPHPQDQQWGWGPPQTPSRQHSNGYDGVPYAQIMPSQTPGRMSPRKISRH